VLGDVGAPDHLAGAAREVFEQRVLTAGQQHFSAAAEHAPRRRVDFDRADGDPLGRQRAALAARQGAQPRQQLAEVERLGQVVVGARVEPGDARFDGITRRQHEDRHVGARRAQLAAHRQAVAARQHDVEDDGVVVVLLALLRRGDAVGRNVDGIRVFAKPFRDESRRARLVLHQQDPHRSSLSFVGLAVGLHAAHGREKGQRSHHVHHAHPPEDTAMKAACHPVFILQRTRYCTCGGPG
jgi:hypothetical protein